MSADIQNKIYRSSLALLTDLYQITMAYGYWKTGIAESQAVFHLTFRNPPFKGRFAIAAGLATAIDYVQSLQFSADDIDYLKTLKDNAGEPLFETAFLVYLKNLHLQIDIDAVEEGTVIFPHEPLVRVTGPLLQCQLLETPLLTIINYQTLIATKAARICGAANGDPVLEFGLRRAHGYDGGLSASRAAYLGGCAATSNLLASKLYDIPVRGTHGHCWVMAFASEIEAFTAYAKALPNNTIFLVDTYNSLAGVQEVVKIGLWLREQGHRLGGIRLDSGDLTYLSINARQILDAAGFNDAIIVASNDLDEQIIQNLKAQGAMINVWGIGTRLVTGHDQGSLDGVYKLGAIRTPNSKWDYKLKLSEQVVKISNPGITRVRRFFNEAGIAIADAIYDEELGIDEDCTLIDPLDMTKQFNIKKGTSYSELLTPIFHGGELIYQPPALAISRQKTSSNLEQFHHSIRRILNPHSYPVGMEPQLYNLKTDLILKTRGSHHD